MSLALSWSKWKNPEVQTSTLKPKYLAELEQ